MWGWKRIFAFVACLAGLGCWATAHAATCEIGWQGDLARFTSSRYRAGAGEYEGLVYLWGGGYTVEEPPPYRYLADMQVYDPSINEWSSLANMPEEKSNFGFAIVDGFAYAIAGFRSSISGAEYLDSCHRYSIAEDEWESIADYPDTLAGLMCAGGGDSKIYCFGGWDGITDKDVAYVYNPGQDQWSPIAVMPHWKDYGYATSDGEFIYLTGGWAETGADNNTYAYDPVQNSYTTMASPTARQSPILAAAGGRLWLAGGCDHTDVPLHVYDQVYDGESWVQTGNTMPFDRAAAAAAYVPDYGIIVMGGWDDEINETRDVQLWNNCVPRMQGVEPATGAVGTAVTITGAQFESNPGVYFETNSKTSYELDDVVVTDATQLAATVPDDIPPGVYDLVVRGSYGQYDRLTAAFTVTAADDDTIDDDTVDDDNIDDDTVDDDTPDDDDAGDDDATDDDAADDDSLADDDGVAADDDEESGGCGC